MNRYEYKNERGDVLYYVYEKPSRVGIQRRIVENLDHRPAIDCTRRLPYRLPELRKAIRRGSSVYVAPCEADADSLIQWCKVPATTLKPAEEPGSTYAQRLPESLANFFRGAYRIVVIEGADEESRALASLVAKYLAEYCYKVCFARFQGAGNERTLHEVFWGPNHTAFVASITQGEELN